MSSYVRERVLLSQNFLKDPSLVALLLERFDLGGAGAVYEIGPGEGIITEQLAHRYGRVVAIEKDPRLFRLLEKKFRDWPNVTIHSGDFLRYRLPRSPFEVFANIPFNITSAIVTRLTTAEYPPDCAYLTMQKEAADMFLGKPQDSLRTILLKPWFEIDIVHRFRRSDFVPVPRVDVVMLRLRKRGPPLVTDADRKAFRDLVVYVYTHWQRTDRHPLQGIITTQQLRQLEWELGFDVQMPPTHMSFDQWLNLFKHLQRARHAHVLRRIAGSEEVLLQQQRKLLKIHRTRIDRHKV